MPATVSNTWLGRAHSVHGRVNASVPQGEHVYNPISTISALLFYIPSPPLFYGKKKPLLVAIVAHCVDKPYLMLYATYGLLERKHSGLNGMSYVYTHI